MIELQRMAKNSTGLMMKCARQMTQLNLLDSLVLHCVLYPQPGRQPEIPKSFVQKIYNYVRQ